MLRMVPLPRLAGEDPGEIALQLILPRVAGEGGAAKPGEGAPSASHPRDAFSISFTQ